MERIYWKKEVGNQPITASAPTKDKKDRLTAEKVIRSIPTQSVFAAKNESEWNESIGR
jgi:hypothetical protein